MPSQPENDAPVATPAPAPSIPFETYNEIIQQLKPLDLTLRSCRFAVTGEGRGTLRTVAQSEPAGVVPELGREPGDDHGSITAIRQRVEFSILDGSGVEIASGDAEYVVRVETPQVAPDTFWRIFLIRNMPIYINPATRDLVASLTTRANLTVQPLPSIRVVPFQRKDAP